MLLNSLFFLISRYARHEDSLADGHALHSNLNGWPDVKLSTNKSWPFQVCHMKNNRNHGRFSFHGTKRTRVLINYHTSAHEKKLWDIDDVTSCFLFAVLGKQTEKENIGIFSNLGLKEFPRDYFSTGNMKPYYRLHHLERFFLQKKSRYARFKTRSLVG